MRPRPPARRLLPAALFVVASGLSGCGAPPDMVGEGMAMPAGQEHAVASDHAVHAAHADGLDARAAADHSLYVLPSSWTDQHGVTDGLDRLAGRPQVVAMVYTHCSFACPALIAVMKRIEEEMATRGVADRVGFTLVSIDPERDTPERLATFAASARLDATRWTLLTGSESDVRALSVLLGVQYRETADGGFEHSNLVTVLDRQGVPVVRLEGLGADPAAATAALETMLDDPASPR